MIFYSAILLLGLVPSPTFVYIVFGGQLLVSVNSLPKTKIRAHLQNEYKGASSAFSA